MMTTNLSEQTFPGLYEHLTRLFYSFWVNPTTSRPKEVPVSTWHAKPTDMPSIELPFVNYEVYIPTTQHELSKATQASIPWAEDHFKERISGIPHNPAPSEQWWPYAVKGNASHKTEEVYSHTYPERYWPKQASFIYYADGTPGPMRGIRFTYGDLRDVINLLIRDRLTRQAYLPVFFPEDTGAVHGERIPCSLGYHFLERQGKLYCMYAMRSCDFMRHWADDMYMTGRLMQYIAESIGAGVGSMICHISSLHIFQGDKFAISNMMGELDDDFEPTPF